MKKLTLSFASLMLLFFVSSQLQAQKLKVLSGNLADLSSIKEFKTEFTYETVKVGKFDDEEDYIKSKEEEAEKKEPGVESNFGEKWNANKGDKYHPKFIELFNEYLAGPGVTANPNASGDAVMHIEVTEMEPGYNVGISRSPAMISMTVTFKNGETELAQVRIEKAPGQDFVGADFDMSYRIQEGYAKAGKELAKLLEKKAYK